MKNNWFHLERFIAEYGHESLLVYGTETAISDIKAISTRYKIVLKYAYGPVFPKERLLAALKKLPIHDFKGLVISRGGKDDSIEVFSEPEVVEYLTGLGIPLYMAIGHAWVKYGLQDCCSYWFISPSDFAHEVRNSINALGDKVPSTRSSYSPPEQENHLKYSIPDYVPSRKSSSLPSKSNSNFGCLILVILVIGILAYFFKDTWSEREEVVAKTAVQPEGTSKKELTEVTIKKPLPPKKASEESSKIYRSGEFPRGHVYTVPDLEDLADKKFENAWLRGKFIVKGKMEDGKSYWLKTYNSGIGLPFVGAFKGEGGTTIILHYIQDPNYDPIGKKLTFSESEPIRLDRVMKMKDGTIGVLATCCRRYR